MPRCGVPPGTPTNGRIGGTAHRTRWPPARTCTAAGCRSGESSFSPQCLTDRVGEVVVPAQAAVPLRAFLRLGGQLPDLLVSLSGGGQRRLVLLAAPPRPPPGHHAGSFV